MCGIAGITQQSQDSATLASCARAMARALAHRGPDGQGVFSRSGVALSHARLSIIDLSPAGHQPMVNTAGTIAVTFNGEIYNFAELRSELRSFGHSFDSNADTEVLIHGYLEWGIEGLLHRLRGMFSFALWDGRDSFDKLILARDRFGIKPLYFARLEGGGVAFASEVRALLASGELRLEDEPKAWLGFLLFGSIPHPLTTSRAARSLPPGHYACIERNGMTVTRYYSLAERLGSDYRAEPWGAEQAKELRTCYERAVELHLVSDAPLGAFLSGGIDSTALVALAVRRKPDLQTLSVTFDEREYSEAPYQKFVAERFRTNHCSVHVSTSDFASELDSYFQSLDQPTVDGVNTYFVARAARRTGLKAVLSGIGADEVFGGYGTARRARWLRGLRVLPRAVWGPLSKLGAVRPSLDRLAYLKEGGQLPSYLAQRGLFSPSEAAKILGAEEAQAWRLIEELEAEYLESGSLSRADEFELYLRDQLLKDADVLGMAHSVEIRVPFLDHELVEAVFSAPTAPPGLPKPLLTEPLRGLLPSEILNRPKRGFEMPMPSWLEALPDLERVRGHWSRSWAKYVMMRMKEGSRTNAAGAFH